MTVVTEAPRAARILELCEDALRAARAAGADEAEAFATDSVGRTVSLQKDDVHCASSEEERVLGLRVLVGGAMGFASTNDPSTLRETAVEAVQLAKAAPPDARNGFAEPRPSTPLRLAPDPEFDAADVAALAAVAEETLARIRDLDPRVRVDSGSVSVDRTARAVANSRGVRAAEERASAGGSLFGMAVDGAEVGSFDADGDTVVRAADLRTAMAAAAERFVVKTLGSLGARKGESFRGPVVFSPEAVFEFVLGNLLSALSAKSVRVGRSPFGGKVGAEVASRGFRLVDEPRRLDRATAASFDREGTPTANLELVRDGALASFLTDAFESRVAAAAATGHARGGAAAIPGIAAWSPSLAAGTTPLAALCAESELAVLVTRFSGSSNATSGEFSGVVKGGFLLRRGVRTPVKEIQLAGNLWELLRRSTPSAETRTIEGAGEAPALRFEDVSVTAG